MNLKELSRPLSISDVDFRVQSINNGGYATILAYKDARVDMNRLDEVVGPLGWQRDYKLIDGKLFCGVAVYNPENSEWIWKWDVGTESNTEKEKGQASDAFKRACFNLGIGRELYSYPVISVKLNVDEWEKKKGFDGKEKAMATYNLKIKEWRWYSEFTDGAISFLAAKDQNGTLRFKWGTMKPKVGEPSYTAASGGEPVVENQSEVKEEANVDAILKKPKEDPEREALIGQYEAMFGKKPHGRMSSDKINQEIEEEAARRMAEKLDEEEELHVQEEPEVKPEPIPVLENPVVHPELGIEVDEEFLIEPTLDTIRNHFQFIETHTDATKFVQWAKELVGKYIGIDADDSIEEFKALCNNHYQKINK